MTRDDGNGVLDGVPGELHQAGEGLTDEQMVEEVGSQTDSEHKYSDFFKREADGTITDTEAAKATADELVDDRDSAG